MASGEKRSVNEELFFAPSISAKSTSVCAGKSVTLAMMGYAYKEMSIFPANGKKRRRDARHVRTAWNGSSYSRLKQLHSSSCAGP